MLDNKLKGPKKGSFEKLAKRLKELGQRPPPKDLMDILNQTEELRPAKDKKIASPKSSKNDLDL